MKKPAILIMSITFVMIGILILEFHLSISHLDNVIPDDYLKLIETVSNQESKILLFGEDLPFPDSIEHQMIVDFDELSNPDLGQIDFIIIHASNHLTNQNLTDSQVNTLKSMNNQGVSIIFVGLSSFDYINIDMNISSNYPYGVGVIKINPNAFDFSLYEIHAPNTENLELRLYNVLKMMVAR